MFRDDSDAENSEPEEFKGSDYIKQYYQNKYGSSFNQKSSKRPTSNYDTRVNEKNRRMMALQETKKINFYGRRDSSSSDDNRRKSDKFKSPQGVGLMERKRLHQSQEKSAN